MLPQDSPRRRVLFIGHEAQRSGAPILLLHLLRWMREHSDVDFDLAVRADGPLVSDYASLCNTVIVKERQGIQRVKNVVDRVRNLRRGVRVVSIQRLAARVAARDIGLIVSNTITNGDLLARLSSVKIPVVCYAHEVDSYFRAMDPRTLDQLDRTADLFIAVTDAIATSLERAGVMRAKIARIDGFVPIGSGVTTDRSRGEAFRRAHGIPLDAILIGGCGTPYWQKGPDLLVHVARMLLARSGGPRLHFAWVGGKPSRGGHAHLAWDVNRAGLSHAFSQIASTASVADYFAALDVFALTSRDDPFPLVAIEAGAAALPVICFEGNAEVVDNSCGVVVPYLNLDAFADAVQDLASNAARRKVLGETLAARVRARHDVLIGAPRVTAMIRAWLAGGLLGNS